MPARQSVAAAIDAMATVVRSMLPRHWRVYASLQALRRRLPMNRSMSRFERLLRLFAEQYPDAFFIQIGSNDGSNLDPLRPIILTSQWSGILVEPVPYLFARLQANYRKQRRMVMENVAIAEQDGGLPFYYLRPASDTRGLPEWYETLGSFSKDVVLKHGDRVPDIEQRIVCETVPCLSFDSLCRKHNVARLDLLHIDAEGYDFRILQQIDFGRFRPRLLIYEHEHLSPADRIECRAMLERHGYRSFTYQLDTMCLNFRDPEPRDEPLILLWPQLEGRGGQPPV